jgi:hypothetical protein
MTQDDKRIGSGPIEERYRREMGALAHMIDDYFNPDTDRKTGFVLMVFPFNIYGRCSYISNADRNDIINVLKQQLAYFSGQPDIEGHA